VGIDQKKKGADNLDPKGTSRTLQITTITLTKIIAGSFSKEQPGKIRYDVSQRLIQCKKKN